MENTIATTQDASGFALKMAAQVALVCASAMIFFYFYQTNIYIATVGFVGGAIIGSLASWKNTHAAKALFLLSVLAVEAIMMLSIGMHLVPIFFVIDIFLLLFFARSWNGTPEED